VEKVWNKDRENRGGEKRRGRKKALTLKSSKAPRRISKGEDKSRAGQKFFLWKMSKSTRLRKARGEKSVRPTSSKVNTPQGIYPPEKGKDQTSSSKRGK